MLLRKGSLSLPRWLSQCVLGCVLAGGFLGCQKQPIAETHVVVSGDTQGWITPCGCAANQAGGLARRASLLHQLADTKHRIYLDAGGSASGTNEYQTMKLEAILEGMQVMGLDAHNIGAPETEFSPAQLDRLAQDTGVQWLSSNLDADGVHLNLRRKLVIRRNGLKILIAGIVDPKLVKNKAWKVKDPIHSVLEAFESEDADLRLVLAYFDESGLFKLAESLPEFDCLVGGPTGQAMKPAQVGPVTVLSSTNKGKFLAGLRATAILPSKSSKKESKKESPWSFVSARPLEVKSDLPEDTKQLKILESFRKRLQGRDFDAAESGFVESNPNHSQGYSIAGSESCLRCHQADQAVWHNTKHSHAWEVLVPKNAHFDPYCQQCHTTGYGLPGGFQNVSSGSSRIHVGCENCHGPSQAHVENPRRKTPYLAKEQCIRCHDHENSPEFAYPAYWNKVQHGKILQP